MTAVIVQVPGPGSHFSVDPENLFLKPGEEHEVSVSFMPKDPEVCEERSGEHVYVKS